MTRTDLPDTIPIFPLGGAMLLPRARLPLHIFEPRYLTMLDDALKTPERLIGMIQPFGDGRLHSIGCAGRIMGFSETDDGRYMISLTGVSRFRLLAEVEGFTPYRRAQVGWSDFSADMGREEHDTGFDRDAFLETLARFFAAQGLSTDWDDMKEASDELLINSLSMMCPFSEEDKQALLEAPCLCDRRETLVTLIDFALRGGIQEDRLQ